MTTMDFDFQVILVGVFFSLIVSVILWLIMRQPSYDEVAASQAERSKLFDSLVTGKKKEKVDKKKNDKPKKGKKKEASEEEKTGNQTDEFTDAADSSPTVRKHQHAKEPEVRVETSVIVKKAESQPASAAAMKETLIVRKHAETSKEAPAVKKHAPEQLVKAAAVIKETKPKTDDLASDAASAQEAGFKDVGKKKDKESKKAKPTETLQPPKDAIKSEGASINGKNGTSVNGKDGASARQTKPVVKAAEATPKMEEVIKVQVVEIQQAAVSEPKAKRDKKKKGKESLETNGASSSGTAGVVLDGIQWDQSVPQLSVTGDQKDVVDASAPTSQRVKAEAQKPVEKVGNIDAEMEQLKATVSKLRRELGEERKQTEEKVKEAQHWANEVHCLHQVQEQHINDATKALSSQVTSLTAQLNVNSLTVHQLHEENRKLKEKGVTQIMADDDNKMQLKLQMDEMSKLALKLNTAENARQNLTDKVAKLEEHLREQERLVREHRDDLARVHAHYASPNQDVERVQLQLQQALLQCKHLQQDNDSAWQQVERSKDAERKLQAALTELQLTEDSIRQLRERNLDLENSLKGRHSAEDSIRLLGECNVELEGEKQKLLANQHVAEEALHHLRERNAELEGDKQRLLANQQSVEDAMRQLQERNRELEHNSSTNHDSALRQLRESNLELESEKQKILTNQQSAEAALQQEKERNLELEGDKQRLLANQQSVEDAMQQLQERNRELEDNKAKCDTAILQLTELNVTLNADFSVVRQKIIELEAKVAASAQQQTNGEESIQAGEQRLNSVQEQLFHSEQRVKTLEGELQSVQHELQSAREQCDSLQAKQNGVVSLEEVAELKKKLAETEEALAKESANKQQLLQKLGSHDHHDGGDVNGGSAC